MLKARTFTDRITQKPLNYGFLTFKSQEEAERCQSEMNNVDCQGHQLIVNLVIDKNQRDPNANILVRNLAPTVTQQQVHDHFIQFGDIRTCKLEIFPNGESRGFCYIQFANKDHAEKAIKESKELVLEGK